jgi:hypothetical protein
MAVQPAPVRLVSLRSGPHKPTEEAQAAQQFQLLLQVIDEHWQSITAWYKPRLQSALTVCMQHARGLTTAF